MYISGNKNLIIVIIEMNFETIQTNDA